MENNIAIKVSVTVLGILVVAGTYFMIASFFDGNDEQLMNENELIMNNEEVVDNEVPTMNENDSNLPNTSTEEVENESINNNEDLQTEGDPQQSGVPIYQGNLTDKTEGKTIRGHEFSQPLPEGTFTYYSSEDGTYNLEAKISNLPDTINDEFYEGWIVRVDPFNFISTGKLQKNSRGEFINTFSSQDDYSDHNQYVLTLEQNDGDPAPADHIVEGFATD